MRVLCIGAHSDDIEIGCLGTLLRLRAEGRTMRIDWAVLSGDGARAAEAGRSAARLRSRKVDVRVVHGDLPDSRFPAEYARAKDLFAALASESDPHVIFTHALEDRHQDHRLAAEMTWQTWRNHTILEYEIPKFEGDLGLPNFYVQLPRAVVERKVGHLMRQFASQRAKSWFTADTFRALMRIRGVECRAASGFAEAFKARKLRY